MNKSKNGITLVALIITVIVLLILAIVSISLVINSGIINKAQQGVDKYSEEEELEQIKLAVASARLKGNGFLTTQNLNSELQDRFGEEATPRSNGWRYKDYNIKENGEVNKSLLPAEYQQVEYIESTGTQYIDTDIKLSRSNTINIIWMLTYNKERENFFIFGARDSATKNNLEFYKNIDGYINLDYGNYQDNRIQIETINLNKWYETKITKELLVNNDIQCNISNTNEFITPPIYIFYANNIFSGSPMKGKIKKFEIENVANFIPCYTTTTVTDVDGISRPKDTIGMYDTVEGKFYVNKGTGTFLKGADV